MPENNDDIDLDGWDLHRAAEENRVDITRELIARGYDVNAREGKEADPHGTHGWTPLHMAARENSLEVARLLIKLGAEVDAQDIFGHTPPASGITRCGTLADRARC